MKEKKKENHGRREFRIPNDVSDFAELTFKKYKKKYGDPYASKKDLRKGYYLSLVDMMPRVVEWLVRYGHIPEAKESKEAIYTIIADSEFVKTLIKMLKKDDDMDGLELLPIIVFDILREASIRHAKQVKEKENDPQVEVEDYDVDDLIELSNLVIKGKKKKLVKAGLNENVAFDVLSVIPSQKVLGLNQLYRFRTLFRVLYEHAKTVENMDINPIAKYVVRKDYYPSLITFLLLEKKEMYVGFTDQQKKFFNDITSWCFNQMEDMNKETIRAIIQNYCDARKKDKDKSMDSNRRFFLSSLPESDFPNIVKVLKKMQDEDASIKEFL